MPRRSIKEQVAESNRPVIVLFLVVLMLLFGGVIADYFARAPSHEMSREILVSRDEWISSSSRRDIVVTLPAPGGESAMIVIPQPGITNVLQIDSQGIPISEWTVDVDLSASRGIEGFLSGNGRVVLFSREQTLDRIELDLASGSHARTVVGSDIRSFTLRGRFLVVEHDGGLSAMDARGRSNLVPIVSGPVQSYAVSDGEDQLQVALVSGEATGYFDVEIVTCSPDLQVQSVSKVIERAVGDQFRSLEDAFAHEDVIDLLFLQRDNRVRSNDLTIVRVRAESGSIDTERRASFPVINTDYRFIRAGRSSATFVMRLHTAYGRNLAAPTVSEHGTLISELTKTRGTSNLSLYFTMGQWNSLVFSEVRDGVRSIYFASSHPDVIRKSTRWTFRILGRALAATATISVMALFLGMIYLFFSSVIPFLTVLGMQRFLGRGRRAKLVLVGIGAAVYTGIKLYVTFFVINRTPNYLIQAPVIGGQPIIYGALAATSLISFALSARFLRASVQEHHSATGTLFRLIGVDSVQYSMLFIVYVVTSLLLLKI